MSLEAFNLWNSFDQQVTRPSVSVGISDLLFKKGVCSCGHCLSYKLRKNGHPEAASILFDVVNGEGLVRSTESKEAELSETELADYKSQMAGYASDQLTLVTRAMRQSGVIVERSVSDDIHVNYQSEGRRKNGNVIRAHYFHKSGYADACKKRSVHDQIVRLLAHQIAARIRTQYEADIKNVFFDKVLDPSSRRPDAVITSDVPNRGTVTVALEVQRSPLSLDNFIQRHEDLKSSADVVIWCFRKYGSSDNLKSSSSDFRECIKYADNRGDQTFVYFLPQKEDGIIVLPTEMSVTVVDARRLTFSSSQKDGQEREQQRDDKRICNHLEGADEQRDAPSTGTPNLKVSRQLFDDIDIRLGAPRENSTADVWVKYWQVKFPTHCRDIVSHTGLTPAVTLGDGTIIEPMGQYISRRIKSLESAHDSIFWILDAREWIGDCVVYPGRPHERAISNKYKASLSDIAAKGIDKHFSEVRKILRSRIDSCIRATERLQSDLKSLKQDEEREKKQALDDEISREKELARERLDKAEIALREARITLDEFASSSLLSQLPSIPSAVPAMKLIEPYVSEAWREMLFYADIFTPDSATLADMIRQYKGARTVDNFSKITLNKVNNTYSRHNGVMPLKGQQRDMLLSAFRAIFQTIPKNTRLPEVVNSLCCDRVQEIEQEYKATIAEELQYENNEKERHLHNTLSSRNAAFEMAQIEIEDAEALKQRAIVRYEKKSEEIDQKYEEQTDSLIDEINSRKSYLASASTFNGFSVGSTLINPLGRVSAYQMNVSWSNPKLALEIISKPVFWDIGSPDRLLYVPCMESLEGEIEAYFVEAKTVVEKFTQLGLQATT